MGPWVLLMAIGFAPGAGTLPAEPCSPTAEERGAPVGNPREWPLPVMCAQEFESSCTSLDGRVRIAIRFKGRRKQRRVRSGFYGGEGWMSDTFYTGTRTLSIEDVASGKRALFVERLRDSRGYTAPGNDLRYLPGRKLVLLLPSHCIRLP